MVKFCLIIPKFYNFGKSLLSTRAVLTTKKKQRYHLGKESFTKQYFFSYEVIDRQHIVLMEYILSNNVVESKALLTRNNPECYEAVLYLILNRTDLTFATFFSLIATILSSFTFTDVCSDLNKKM